MYDAADVKCEIHSGNHMHFEETDTGNFKLHIHCLGAISVCTNLIPTGFVDFLLTGGFLMYLSCHTPDPIDKFKSSVFPKPLFSFPVSLLWLLSY